MFSLPYQTTICNTIYKNKMDQLTNKIRRAKIILPFPEVTTPFGNELKEAYFVTPREEHEDVPLFTQYINNGDNNRPELIIDSRQYMKYDERSGTYKLIAINDWQFQCIRLALNARLLKGDEAFFSRLGDLPIKVFIRWISGALVSRYTLGAEPAMAMWVICAYYYFAMCNPELREVDIDTRIQWAPMVSRVTGVNPDVVMNIADHLGELKNGEDLIRELSTNSMQQRTGTLKFQDLYLLISNSWIGVNNRENVGVAIEHLPTYIAMLCSAITERSYRKAILFQRIEKDTQPKEQRAFTDIVFRAVDEQFKNRGL